jgi:hypothetical protein
MAVSVLSAIGANATTDGVRLAALRAMPQLLEQKKYQQELRPLLSRSISSLIPNVTEVEVLRSQTMLDIQTLVEADESHRKPLISELSGLDRSWSFINNKPGGNPDQKQIRIGLQIKLALLSLTQDYQRAQEIAADLVDLARSSPELSRFVSDQLDMLLISSLNTALRVLARSAIRSLDEGNSLPRLADEQRKELAPVFIVAADESQQTQGEKLAQVLKDKGNVQGVDVIPAKDPKLKAPLNLEIRYSKAANEKPFLTSLAATVKKFTGEEPKLVDLSTGVEAPAYEIWLSRH